MAYITKCFNKKYSIVMQGLCGFVFMYDDLKNQ